MRVEVNNGRDSSGKPLVGISLIMSPEEAKPFCDLIHGAAMRAFTEYPPGVVAQAQGTDNEPAYMQGDGQHDEPGGKQPV
jgi:hypothetical protein